MDSTPNNFSHKFTLVRHTKAVNALAISYGGSLLLSGGNDSRVVIWNLCLGEMIQELSEPEDAFVFGASDGGIHLYERHKDEPLFAFRSITLAHDGAIESFAWDPVCSRLASAGSGQVQLWKLGPEAKSFVSLTPNPEKQPYIARSVHFYDDGSSLLVSFLECGLVYCFSCDPWDLKWKKKVNGRIGSTCLDGQQLFIANLRDGVDRYTLPTMYLDETYHHAILVNIPVQISVAHEAGRLIVGGDNGFVRVFDYQTGAFHEKLDHGHPGDRIVAVAAFEGTSGCIVATGSALDGHSSVKIWALKQQGSPPPAAQHFRQPSSAKQMLLFAIICISINVIMRLTPSIPYAALLRIGDLTVTMSTIHPSDTPSDPPLNPLSDQDYALITVDN